MGAPAKTWKAIVLAAGRGPDDPMAKAYGVTHKCLLPVGGKPMLARVIDALQSCRRVGEIFICIEDPTAAARAFGGTLPEGVRVIAAKESAAASVLAAVEETGAPVLVTTADHALLSKAMLDYFLAAAEEMKDTDLAVALARREVVLGAFPQAKRTWMKFGRDAVTACNLFALKTPRALKAVDFWRKAEKNRKKPWKIAMTFGPVALLRVALGLTSLQGVFAHASRRLGLVARPVLMPMAEAAVDVDKPADYELVHAILEGPASEIR